MTEFFQLILSGLATGAIYALAAIGFTLLWQTSQTINFSQGEFVMIPVFAALIAMNMGINFYIACLIAIALSMVLMGYAFKKVIVDPLMNKGTTLPIVISTIAVGLIMKDVVKDFYSAEAHRFPTLLPDMQFNAFGLTISLAQIGVIVVALGSIMALTYFLDKTKTGRQMQATAQNPSVATILGINTNRMILYTFLINAGLAAIASLLVSPIIFAKFTAGEAIGISAFIAAIVGGFNQVRGAIVGGFAVGVAENLAASYVSTQYRVAIPLILLVAIILFRPQGLVGRREERSV